MKITNIVLAIELTKIWVSTLKDSYFKSDIINAYDYFLEELNNRQQCDISDLK